MITLINPVTIIKANIMHYHEPDNDQYLGNLLAVLSNRSIWIMLVMMKIVMMKMKLFMMARIKLFMIMTLLNYDDYCKTQ